MRFAIPLALMAGMTGAAVAATPSPAAPMRAIVTYKSLPPGIASELNLMRVAEGVVTEGVVLPTINSVALTAPRSLLELLAKDARVLAIRPQRRLKLNLYGSVEQINARGVELAETVGPAACAKERPGVTGAGVTVAVIDSGIHAAHPGLLGRVLQGFNFEGSLPQREAGVFSVDESDAYAEATGASALQDEVGHGTHCAGIIGGDGTGAAGLDLAGVAPGVQMIAMKIASAGNGVAADIGFEANSVQAIDYLTRHKDALGVRVASNSWGLLAEEEQAVLLGPTDFDPVAAAIRAAVAEGIVMVFAAGNDGGGPDEDTIRAFPNSMEEVITVGSACKANNGSCQAGQVNGFTSRGPAVDVAAPGDQILSAMAPNSILAPLGQTLEGDYFGDSPSDEVQNRAGYMRLSGTSMATPHVAGVVALLLQANPELTPQQVHDILTTTATDMVVEGDLELLPGFDKASGHGMVNVRKALAMAVGAPVSDSCPAPDVPPTPGNNPPVIEPKPTTDAIASPDGRFGGSMGLLLSLGLLLGATVRQKLRR